MPIRDLPAGPSVDVVVVGAGFAGLTAARRLRQTGCSVVMLEADDRVGGRTKAGHIAGDVVDLGGQSVGPTQTHVLALASELEVAAYPQYVAGRNIIDIAGHHATCEAETPSLAPDAMDEFAEVLGKIETLAARTPIPHAWDAPEAAEWDGQTVESWLVANARHPVS